MNRIKQLWSTRNGKFIILSILGLIIVFCCIVPAISQDGDSESKLIDAEIQETAIANAMETISASQEGSIQTEASIAVEPTKPQQPTSDPFSKLIVPAGQLAQYSDTYSNYKEVFVTKINGSLDERPNDLEELCLDWLYYQNKIIEYTQAQNNDKANDARTAWNEINAWLNEYNENDVSTMFTIIENRNN